MEAVELTTVNYFGTAPSVETSEIQIGKAAEPATLLSWNQPSGIFPPPDGKRPYQEYSDPIQEPSIGVAPLSVDRGYVPTVKLNVNEDQVPSEMHLPRGEIYRSIGCLLAQVLDGSPLEYEPMLYLDAIGRPIGVVLHRLIYH